jgi:hypothetical protein
LIKVGEIIFSEGLLEGRCGLFESKGILNIAPFGKGNGARSHMTLTHTLRNEK